MSEGNARAAAIVIVLGVLVFGAGAGCLGVLSRIADDVESIAKATATTDTTTTTAPTTTTAAVNQTALAQAMMDGPHVSSESDAECWASALIADIGPDRMAEVGLTPEVFKGWGFPSGVRLSEVHRNAFASAYERCIDYAPEQRVGEYVPNVVVQCLDRGTTPAMEIAYAHVLLGDIDRESGLDAVRTGCTEEYWASVRDGEG